MESAATILRAKLGWYFREQEVVCHRAEVVCKSGRKGTAN